MLYDKEVCGLPIRTYGIRTKQVPFEAWGSAVASGDGGVLYLDVTFRPDKTQLAWNGVNDTNSSVLVPRHLKDCMNVGAWFWSIGSGLMDYVA